MSEAPTSHKYNLDWKKVASDGKSYSDEELKFYSEVASSTIASSELFQLEAKEMGIELSEDSIRALFLLFSEVIHDLLVVSSVNLVPLIIPFKDSDKTRIANYFKHEGNHCLGINVERLIGAASVLEKLLEIDEVDDLKLETDELAEAIYAITHEMGHLRQDENLPYFQNRETQAHNIRGYERTQENQMAYASDLAESNAHAFATRYLKVKKLAKQSSPIWRALDFSRVIGKEIESQGRYKALSYMLEAKKILDQRDKTSDADEYSKLNNKAMELVEKMQNHLNRLEKAHKKIGSVPPPEPEEIK